MTAQNYVALGKKAKNEKKYEEAIGHFSEAIKLDAATAEIFYQRGDCYYQQEKFDEAIEDCSRAITLDSKMIEAYVKRGFSYYEKKQFDEALQGFIQANKLDVMKKNIHIDFYNMGCCYEQKKNVDKAIDCFTNSINSNRSLWQAFRNRGMCYELQRKFDEAIQDLNEAIKLAPQGQNGYLYNNCGVAYEEKSEVAKAVEYYAKAIPLGSKNAPDNLFELLNSDTLTGLNKISKTDLFRAIKVLPEEKQISLLRKCLNKTTPLGARFWNPEGVMFCSLNRGTLKEICDYLKIMKITDRNISINTFSIFESASSSRSGKTSLLNNDGPDLGFIL